MPHNKLVWSCLILIRNRHLIRSLQGKIGHVAHLLCNSLHFCVFRNVECRLSHKPVSICVVLSRFAIHYWYKGFVVDLERRCEILLTSAKNGNQVLCHCS
jgi:hypothetical protein